MILYEKDSDLQMKMQVMMIKRIPALLLILFHLTPSFSQSWDEVKRNTETYLFGEGWGATVDEADQQALSSLTSKISVVVSSDFSIIEDERTTNGILDASSYTNLKLQTYSSATLTNTERIVIENDADQTHIGRYIKRSEINRIFEGRIRTIKGYIRLGKEAEKVYKIDDALRNFYWAFSLLKSVQHPSEVTYDDDSEGKTYPLTWLPQRISSIMKDLEVKVIGNDSINVDLSFTYKGNKVSSLDFTYFDGRNWSNICSAKDGRGTIEFGKGLVPNNIQINYEYAYRGQTHINQEVQSVLSVVKGQAIREARTNITIDGKIKNKDFDNILPKSSSSKNVLLPVGNDKSYRNTLNAVLKAINTHNYTNLQKYFTADGLEMFKSLIQYGNARILNTNNCTFSQLRDNVIGRSIQMSFSFRNGIRKQFVENVVFTFNQEGKIDCIAFGLDNKAQKDILERGAWTPIARQTIIQFLENYKTAYALKRIDYLKTIFDDNAVIIVGHVAERMVNVNKNSDLSPSFQNQKIIKRVQYSKEQYLKKLEACFRSNEFINIRFANNDVRKAKEGEEYGIQIKQDYYSSNYGDQGYLYLQVDLEEPDKPIIKVRTWQSEPDPEIGLFGIGNW